jgi:hypothetical protein
MGMEIMGILIFVLLLRSAMLGRKYRLGARIIALILRGRGWLALRNFQILKMPTALTALVLK